ncbi:MAG: LysM peptidoglycan-binding domain-containing protein [Ardenticatenaceae bacterium]|nr:LysM peptidoglycan-binding domain-containing protein [Ardenticatenaceae bacterium]
MNFRHFALLIAALIVLAACASQPQTVEVTRIVELPATVEVPVEVTRIVEQQTTVEVPVEVEVTRLVELVITATPALVDTAVPTPTATPIPTAAPLPSGSTYTVQPGDTLSAIATKTGTAVADIMAANNLTSDSFIAAGQELLIPGWDGVAQTSDGAAPPPAADTPPETAVQGPNLLPNPSFEGDWYFYLYNELQIPDGWQLTTDEGPNTLEPGSGGLFNRPEVRVVPSQDLPPAEQSIFIFDGNKTVKAFKGGAPTSFSLFTDVALQPGSYRFQIRFFPDTVAAYDNSKKTFASDPLSAEVRIIQDNGGTGWQGTQIGQRNTLNYDFTITEARTVRLGASFRNRFVMANNGWFLDDWSLYTLTP